MSVVASVSELEMADGIPDLELPPPIIPLRRYGHNFLDKKVFIQLPLIKEMLGLSPLIRRADTLLLV
jgi:hypothetical protein